MQGKIQMDHQQSTHSGAWAQRHLDAIPESPSSLQGYVTQQETRIHAAAHGACANIIHIAVAGCQVLTQVLQE